MSDFSSPAQYIRSAPISFKKRIFAPTINEISNNFCEIYNDARAAEQYNLANVCGVGYRKALEFLIKDYLISKYPEGAEDIKNKPLGRCIENDIQNEQIKEVSRRAAWLGNDEAHYVRKWEGKDLENLKKLIELVLNWMEMEKSTEDLRKDMPSPGTGDQP